MTYTFTVYSGKTDRFPHTFRSTDKATAYAKALSFYDKVVSSGRGAMLASAEGLHRRSWKSGRAHLSEPSL